MAQEPRILAAVSKDPVMVDNYLHDKDIYSTLASMAYKLPYDQCTKDTPEGKVRRNHGKVLQLALSYGMQVRSLSQQLSISVEEAQELYDAFKRNLHVAFEYGESARRFCRANGYVKTLWGRKRRFPAYTLPPYEVLGDVSPERRQAILSRVRKARWDERYDLIQALSSEYGVTIIDNTREQRAADTQILNSIIQGSAAEMTKMAMVLIANDPQMKEWKANLVLVIHDEIIVECPKENAEKVAVRLEQLMSESAKTRIEHMPFKAESEVMERWHKD